MAVSFGRKFSQFLRAPARLTARRVLVNAFLARQPLPLARPLGVGGCGFVSNFPGARGWSAFPFRPAAASRNLRSRFRSFTSFRSFGCGPPLSAGLIAFCRPPHSRTTHGDRHARLAWIVAGTTHRTLRGKPRVNERTTNEPKNRQPFAAWLNLLSASSRPLKKPLAVE